MMQRHTVQHNHTVNNIVNALEEAKDSESGGEPNPLLSYPWCYQNDTGPQAYRTINSDLAEPQRALPKPKE
jgi:subtilase family serine protease